jgi:gluconolactonase
MEYSPLPPDRWPDSPGRYPDPAVRAVDPRFERHQLHNTAVERIACLLWSDIPNNRMLGWDEATGAVTMFRTPSN